MNAEYKPKKFSLKKEIKEYIIETAIKISSKLLWLWVSIEAETKNILAIGISEERNMFVAEHFLSDIVKEYGLHPVSTDGGTS